MPEILDFDDEETGCSGTCPFCKGIYRTNADNTKLSHSLPECIQFKKMSHTDYLDYVKTHPVKYA